MTLEKRVDRPKTVAFAVTQTLRAPVDDVWTVLGEFGTEHRWAQNLKHCERDTHRVAVGTVRTCRLRRPLMGRTTVREQLTEFVRGEALAYDLDGPAGPFLTASSRWTTSPGPDRTTVLTVEGRFTPRGWATRLLLWPLAKLLISRLTRRVVLELEAFVLSAASPT